MSTQNIWFSCEMFKLIPQLSFYASLSRGMNCHLRSCDWHFKGQLTLDFDVTESRKRTATTLNYNHLFSHGFNSLIINI